VEQKHKWGNFLTLNFVKPLFKRRGKGGNVGFFDSTFIKGIKGGRWFY
jgi:hypothetical protein